jgi:hypothetical protein
MYFSISFLGKPIGTLQLTEVAGADRKTIQINGEIFSSPFSLFNGQFEYKTITTGINNKPSDVFYESNVDSFKERKISYWVRNDQLIALDVFPKKERTKFTNPKLIDFEFIDPALSITKIFNSPCKNSFAVYDGRRVIDIIGIEQTSKFECVYLYKIREGPGHLALFDFKEIVVSVFFDQERNSVSRSVMVKAGPFRLFLDQVP